MEHMNHCRQMVKQFSKSISEPGFLESSRLLLSHAIELSNSSHKFLLPDGGRLYDDPAYRALDDSQVLHLPYPVIALEYTRHEYSANADGYRSTKAILFAREQGELIVVSPIMWIDHERIWGPAPEAAIPRTGYLDRVSESSGRTVIKMFRADDRVPLSDYADELGALLCFLNVLQCNNVNVERSSPKKCGKNVKSALPFDSYHVLTINAPQKSVGGTPGCSNSHRSPREHLRRGHIRRLDDGRRIWVNATVVAASANRGAVGKDYRIKTG